MRGPQDPCPSCVREPEGFDIQAACDQQVDPVVDGIRRAPVTADEPIYYLGKIRPGNRRRRSLAEQSGNSGRAGLVLEEGEQGGGIENGQRSQPRRLALSSSR